MRFSGELAALGTAACFGSASNLFAAAGRRMGSHKLNRLRITTAWMFLTIALYTVHRVWWPSSATPLAIIEVSRGLHTCLDGVQGRELSAHQLRHCYIPSFRLGNPQYGLAMARSLSQSNYFGVGDCWYMGRSARFD